MTPHLTELIARAPWREAVTYRDTWPHEYVLTEKDNQRELLAAVCARFRVGEGVACRFFNMNNTYLFIGDYKYWLMTDYNAIDPCNDKVDYALNRARLYRDRRDFIIQTGDSGKSRTTPLTRPTRPDITEGFSMAEDATLLAYLVPKLTNQVEDTATDALAFILNRSATCRGALDRLLRDGDFNPEPIAQVKHRSRTRMVPALTWLVTTEVAPCGCLWRQNSGPAFGKARPAAISRN